MKPRHKPTNEQILNRDQARVDWLHRKSSSSAATTFGHTGGNHSPSNLRHPASKWRVPWYANYVITSALAPVRSPSLQSCSERGSDDGPGSNANLASRLPTNNRTISSTPPNRPRTATYRAPLPSAPPSTSAAAPPPRASTPSSTETIPTRRYTTIAIPTVVFQYRGATTSLDPAGILYPVSASQTCLAFAPNGDDSDMVIIGNTQQRRFNVVYDVMNKRIGFGPGGC
ncbi:uncharacterized protein A4U43_C05F9990 [Asparagus officinalis]|uniref:Peptidase A1 domain-containing protein n=1 Tax=Asparagus officinalis TaxID=4686 RepID=A0A5P1EW00_ASPOF|nr:uncharacterized protein A4U43_C05F9990 [Asparagus officinalis]